MAQSSINFLEKLKELITAPGFKGVPSTMYVPQVIVRDFAQANSSLQFLIMKECDGKYIFCDVSMFACFCIHTINQFAFYEKSESYLILSYVFQVVGSSGMVLLAHRHRDP